MVITFKEFAVLLAIAMTLIFLIREKDTIRTALWPDAPFLYAFTKGKDNSEIMVFSLYEMHVEEAIGIFKSRLHKEDSQTIYFGYDSRHFCRKQRGTDNFVICRFPYFGAFRVGCLIYKQ